MLKERSELEEKLIPIMKEIYPKKRTLNLIKNDFAKFDVDGGEITGYFGSPEIVKDVDLRLLYLLTESTFNHTNNLELDPMFFFTESEKKESYQYSGALENEDSLKFPLTFANATIVGNGAFMVTMNIKTIKKLVDNQLLHYNFEIQREGKFTKKKDKIIIEPTVNMNNVKEIVSHLKNGTLVPTVLVFNAATRTSDTGEELTYDSKKMELTINSNSRLDIVDGYHRTKALSNALELYPDINFNFAVLITNYSTKKAQQYQAQLAKATPISKTRVQELEAKRYSDVVVQQLREESDLKGRISQTSKAHTSVDELVAYNTLADTIDEMFKMETKVEALDVADYLTDFFNYLIGLYPEEFIKNPQETRKVSLINDNNMFAGYVVLASRMMDKEYKVNKLKTILKDINFNRDNPLWEELEILNNKTIKNSNKTRRGIIDYFKELSI